MAAKSIKKKVAKKKSPEVIPEEKIPEKKVEETTTDNTKPVTSYPDPTILPGKRAFSQWGKFKKNEDLAIGARIRFDIDPSENLTEAEYNSFINRFLKS